MNSLNKELKRVIENFGVYRARKYYSGEAELKGEFDYSYHIKTDGNIFGLQTQKGWFYCPAEKVDWRILWDRLGDIPVNEDEELEESFEHFEKGADKMDVWHWFEWFFNISLGKEVFG